MLPQPITLETGHKLTCTIWRAGNGNMNKAFACLYDILMLRGWDLEEVFVF